MRQQAIDRQPSSPAENDLMNLDEEVHGRIQSALAKSGYYSVRRITCSMRGSLLTLSGQVPSYYLKQIAQTVVIEALNRPTRIDNRLEVAVSRG